VNQGTNACRAVVPERASCLWIAAVAVLTVSLGACSTLRVGSDFDHAAHFSGYHTYALMVREHRGMRNPLTVQRTEDAIEAELGAKGFQKAADAAAADFIVDFTIGVHERTDVESYPAPYASPWWGLHGWWGGPYWGEQIDVHQYHEGTLSIDIFDGRTHRPVWHGWAKKDLSRSDIEKPAAPIREAVSAILRGYPPG